MAKALICDRCKQPTARIVAKVFMSPKNGKRNDHSNYTAHADIGECCGEWLLREVTWQKRVKQTTPRKKRQQRTPRVAAS